MNDKGIPTDFLGFGDLFGLRMNTIMNHETPIGKLWNSSMFCDAGGEKKHDGESIGHHPQI